jgi:hypothetical protein
MYCKGENCEFYAGIDGYCSSCISLKDNNNNYKKNLMKTKITDENVINFMETLIHTSNTSGKEICLICDEINVETHSKFACICNPQVCLSCLDKTSLCPNCNENQYYILNNNQIKYLLENNCKEKSILITLNKIIKNNQIKGNLSVKNLISSAKEIKEVYEELDKKITLDYRHMNNIFSFAFDIWNIPQTLNNKGNTAYCYKAMNITKNSYIDFWNNRFNCAKMNQNIHTIE